MVQKPYLGSDSPMSVLCRFLPELFTFAADHEP